MDEFKLVKQLKIDVLEQKTDGKKVVRIVSYDKDKGGKGKLIDYEEFQKNYIPKNPNPVF